MKRLLTATIVATLAMATTAQKLELPGFTKVDIDGPYEVKISKAGSCGVWLEASPDMAKLIEIKVEENELDLSCKQKIYELKKGSFLRVWVDLPNLEKIEASGTCTVQMQGKFEAKGKEFEVDLDDVASVKGLELDADKCSVELSDVTNIRIVGIFKEFELETGGNSNADLDIETDLFKCEAKGNSGFEGVYATTAKIEMDGSSRGRLSVTESLDVELDDNSKLSYSGPKTLKINSDVKSSSKLEKKLEYR